MAGMKPNEKIDIVIRPEDLEITTVEKGKLIVTVDTQLFRGVHYELSTYDKDGNEWLVHSLKKAEVGAEIGLDFDPEAIHVMRLNETEEEFDKRLEAYGDRRRCMNKTQKAVNSLFIWIVLFVIAPIALIVYYSCLI